MQVFGNHPAHAPANFLVWTSGSPPILDRIFDGVKNGGRADRFGPLGVIQLSEFTGV